MSKSDSFKKTVLITGCSDGGIGAALARSFRDRGFHVFATLRNTSKAGALAQADEIDTLELEVTSRESIDRCAEAVAKHTGGRGLDVLVNNAGADYVVPLLDTSVDDARRLFDINVWSILSMSQAFAPLLIQAHGTICNISSIAGVMPLAWAGIYSSSKIAAKQIGETLRVELAPLGVHVVTVMCGAVHTPIHDKAGELTLPEGSYYRGAQDIIKNQRKGLMKPGSQQVDVTAQNIVADVLGGSNGVIWRGGTATLSRYLTWLLPTGLLERVVNKDRGLAQVKRADGEK